MKALKITILTLVLALTACNSNPFGKPSGDPTASPDAPAPTPDPGENGKEGSGPGDNGSNPQPTPPLPAGPNFQVMSSQVFNNCVRCHSGFRNYDTVVRQLSSIEVEVRDGNMPPSGPLRADIQELLFKWIQLGAPQ